MLLYGPAAKNFEKSSAETTNEVPQLFLAWSIGIGISFSVFLAATYHKILSVLVDNGSYLLLKNSYSRYVPMVNVC